jgi:hypothetical protein
MTLLLWCVLILSLYAVTAAVQVYQSRPVKTADPEKVKKAAHEMEYSVMVAVEKAQDEAAVRMLLAEAGLFHEVSHPID